MVNNKAGNTVLIVQAMAFTKYLGHIKVKNVVGVFTTSQVNFDDDGKVESWQGMPILLDNTYEKVSH